MPTAAMALSPTTSPRLPSPPPIAEDQLGPKSPTDADPSTFPSQNHVAQRRIRPGTKSAHMPEGPPLIDIAQIDTAYQLTEHLKALYNAAIHPVHAPDPSSPASPNGAHLAPIDRATALRLSSPPDAVDRAIWLYELCRFLCQKVNAIIIGLFADDPPCSAQTCSEMRASEWQYLCAVHDPPKPCCAIDYCCHTLDWAANVLTSQKHFPSRMTLAPEHQASHQQMRQLTNIFRRVYRIFAHAWFQHRQMFWKVENRSGLYMFFKTVCDQYNLIPEDNYTIPPEAEGRTPPSDSLPPSTSPDAQAPPAPDNVRLPDRASAINTGHTTKRHRQTPSADLSAISTVPEEMEEDDSRSVADTVVTSIELDPDQAHQEPLLSFDTGLDFEPTLNQNDIPAAVASAADDTMDEETHEIPIGNDIESGHTTSSLIDSHSQPWSNMTLAPIEREPLRTAAAEENTAASSPQDGLDKVSLLDTKSDNVSSAASSDNIVADSVIEPAELAATLSEPITTSSEATESKPTGADPVSPQTSEVLPQMDNLASREADSKKLLTALAPEVAAKGTATTAESNPKSMASGETSPEANPEAKPEANPAAKPEAKPEAELEAKSKTTPEVEPEVRPESKSEAQSKVKLEASPKVIMEVDSKSGDKL